MTCLKCGLSSTPHFKTAHYPSLKPYLKTVNSIYDVYYAKLYIATDGVKYSSRMVFEAMSNKKRLQII